MAGLQAVGAAFAEVIKVGGADSQVVIALLRQTGLVGLTDTVRDGIEQKALTVIKRQSEGVKILETYGQIKVQGQHAFTGDRELEVVQIFTRGHLPRDSRVQAQRIGRLHGVVAIGLKHPSRGFFKAGHEAVGHALAREIPSAYIQVVIALLHQDGRKSPGLGARE